MSKKTSDTSYPYVLDHKPGFFLGWFLYRLFRRVQIDESMKEELKQMHRDGTVVYAIKYRGHLDYLLYHYNFRRRRLPYPKIAFDLNISAVLPIKDLVKIMLSQLSSLFRRGGLPNPYQSGFYADAIRKGTTALIFLVDPKGFARHFVHAEKDHLEFLLGTQKEMERPIFIVPQLVLYKRTPEKDYASLRNVFFGFKDKPGVIRKTVLFFRHNRRAVIDFGRPLNLKTYLASQSETRSQREMALKIRQTLVDSIDQQKRVTLGPIMRSRQQLKEIVLMDPKLNQKIKALTSGNGKRLRQLRKKSGEYFDEIAADYNSAYIEFLHIALTWLWSRVFEGVDVDTAGLARVREWARKGPLIFIPSHKSHIDYLILNYVLYNHHMHIPRIAAGQNLAFWPIGHIFRKCGAFFIRRSFRGARLYSEVFNRYVRALLEEGHPIEFFIEGGRSRNGKLVLPKTGFLSILMRAYEDGYCDDLVFVPTSIIYDRILEERAYLREMGGGLKDQENVWQVIKARRFLEKRHGKIYIRFSQPFSFKEYLSTANTTGQNTPVDLAFHLVQAINEVSLVTPLSLVATAILSNHRRGFNAAELLETVEILLDFLQQHEVPLASMLIDPAATVQEALMSLAGRKIVATLEGLDGDEEAFYFVDDDKKMELEYYKNSIIHFFIPHAFVATSLLAGDDEMKAEASIVEDYEFMERLFRNEFIFEKRENLRHRVNVVLSDFEGAGFLSRPDGKGFRVTKRGFDKLRIWAALVKTFIESYWIAAKTMSQEKAQGKEGNPLKRMDYLGRRFHKLGVIDHIGALSQPNFKNALRFINEDILNTKDPAEDPAQASEGLAQLSQRLYDLSHYRS
jgi:glycerol-3-phosphate O-acyltransferase